MADDNPDLKDLNETSVEEPEVETSTADLQELEPPKDPPPLVHEYHEHEGPRWPTIILYLISALIVAALVVMLARAIYHKVHKTTPEPRPNPPVSVPEPGAGSTHKTKKTHTSSQSSNNVPNTGPGNTLAMFTAITIAAAGLHYIASLRRSVKE